MSNPQQSTWRRLRERVDGDRLLARWLLPGARAVGAMAVGFALVGAVLLAREELLLVSVWTQVLALAVMYLCPHLVAGYWTGHREGLVPEAPIAAGLAPVLVLVVALAAFGGPVTTPLWAPLVTLAAVGGWSLAFAAGMAVGARFTRDG